MSGWEDLGNMIGGGGNATYEKAFQEGRFRSAQTEDALTQARINQAKAVDQELTTKQKTELLANPAALKNPDEATLAQLLVGDLGANYQAASTGMGTQQNIRLKDQVANVNTSNEQRLRNLQAIEGKPSADIQQVGPNDSVNLADDLQVPAILPSAKYKVDQAGEGGTPQMQNYKFLTGLGAPPGPETFGNIVRGPAVINAGGVTYERPGLGNPTAPIKPLVDAATTAGNAALLAKGKGEGAALGAQTAAAPGKIDKAEELIGNIDALLSDPGFDTIYGISGKIDPRNYIPGTDAARAGGRLSTINAETFGLAIEQMKGLGALSNAEGQKVQTAFTRATDPNLSEEDARVAWQELQTRMNRAVTKARGLAKNAILPTRGVTVPAAAGPPPGFVLMEDANGNQAYVGPNGEVEVQGV